MDEEKIRIRGQPQQSALHTMKDAAEIIGIPYWKLQRATKKGLVPTYSLLDSKKLVRVTEILQLMINE